MEVVLRQAQDERRLEVRNTRLEVGSGKLSFDRLRMEGGKGLSKS